MESSSCNLQPSASTSSVSRRVSNACQRCRQQKLKCDVHRPCTLCVRAGVTCSAAAKPVTWKAHHPGRASKKARTRKRPTSRPHAKYACLVASPEYRASVAPSLRPGAFTQAEENPRENRSTTAKAVESPWVSSSAAVQFMEEAFHQHDTTTPEGRETSAFSASHWIQANTLDTAECEDLSITGQRQKRSPASKQNAVYNRIRPFGATSPAEAQLLSQLPQLEAATLLLDNYFDRIHWFMLVFHQSDFKERFRQLYEGIRRPLPELRAPLGFLGVFAAVCVISLSYTNAQQKAKLSSCGIQPAVLRQQLLTTLRLRLLDVVSQGSIEAVQACVLLGSFYLYHGEPELAWPICGCGLRIAQALNLHRRIPSQVFGPPDLDNPTQRAEETRKRCWWAVYEIETFCSMLYGFPLSINDDDCDVDLLDPYPLRSGDSSWHAVSWKEKGQATLLSYKHSMVQLSIIVKSALVDLYGLRRSSPEKRTPRVSGQHRLHSLIATVANLEQRLQLWYTNLPKQLLIDSITVSGVGLRKAALNETSANTYFHHLFPLQALSLKLGFENARILIHRPLLSYKMVTSARTTNMQGHPHTTNAPDPCRSSIQTCRDAALQISTISSLPIVRDAADTYAASFVSLHLLTAAVALCILTSLNPLSQESYDCKMGIRRLMEMQSRLRARSIVAEQGLGVSKKLLSLVLTKEMEKMLEMPHQTEETGNEVEAAQNAQGTCSTSGKRQTQTENKLGESDSSNGHAVDRPSIEVASVSTSATNTAANLTLDFYEDPMIAQALQEFEQVINCMPNESVGDGPLPFSSGEQGIGSCFNSQDHGWIWGSNYLI